MSVLRRAMSPPFIAAAALLLLSAAAVHGVIWARGMHLIKQEAPLREPLFLLEHDLGPYQRVEEHRLSSEELEEVGTEQYVLWTYEARDGDARPRRVHLFLAYHTGMPEARPRVSEQMHLVPGRVTDTPLCEPLTFTAPFGGRSQVAATDDPKHPPHPASPPGERGADLNTGGRSAAGTRGGPPVLCVRNVTPSGGGTDVPVAYAFIVNGQMVGSREAVHGVWTDPDVARAWWLKIEVRVEGAADVDEVRGGAGHFLEHALPAIAKLLPMAEAGPGADDQ